MKQFVTILIVLAGLSSYSQSVDSLIVQGNRAYNSGQYDVATERYEQVIAQGWASAELYYNTGNAYFKMNKIPDAVLYYEKARKLAPKNTDINFNLNLANSRIIDKIEAVPEFFLKTWWNDIINIFDTDTWGRITIAAFMVVIILLFAFFISRSVLIRKLAFWTSMVVLALTISCYVIASQKYAKDKVQHSAIIFTPTVTVKSSPSEGSVDLFVIHEGTKVLISDKVEGWSEIRIANGSVGWVKTDVYQPI